MRGRRSADRWLTEGQRAAISRALLRARLDPSIAPPGYESVRGPLWVDFQALRTAPSWEDFQLDMGDLRSTLLPLIDRHVIWDTTGQLAAFLDAAGALQQAWDTALGVESRPPRELTTDDGFAAPQDGEGRPLEELIDWLCSRMAQGEPSAIDAENAAIALGLTDTLRGSLAASDGSYKALAFAEPDTEPKSGGVLLWRVRDGIRSGPWYFREHGLTRPTDRR